MRHGSLFSGIGGFDLAAEWMGWENVFHCENAVFQRNILRKRFPNSRSIEDVRDIYRFTDEYEDLYGDREVMYCSRHNADFGDCKCIGCSEWEDEIGQIDILTAGFPCQPFSNNGKRHGKNDERNLWPETIRIVRCLQPGWVVPENVPGIISWNNGEIFKEIVTDLEEEGYTVWPVSIPVTAVGGYHKRERIWFIAHNKSQRIQGMRPERQQISHTLDKPLLPLRNSNGQWEIEPDVCRTPHGLPGRVDRLKSLGNAVVPQVAYEIFKAIQQTDDVLKSNIL